MVGDCCLILIILLLPPLGVFLMKGCGADFWINLCLTILGYIPGHLHGFYVLIKEREQRRLQGYGVNTPAYGAVPPA
ncbi:plasma membrane proteolipid Pmp3 [Apophysomyces ossiformis]|uniref:Plasma membrane proteolipid Pmp3 n=1 Tax=Apophysomyces ossiformis TaxID=679940 RepID=A0A8H7BQA9_9FUNG|nr:plasma membrane proteolipid Pmp3 [Apophysomyces ossiformis]